MKLGLEEDLAHESSPLSQWSMGRGHAGQKVGVEQAKNEVKYIQIDLTIEKWFEALRST